MSTGHHHMECKACGSPLKLKVIVRNGKTLRMRACKKPTCRLFGKAV